jgi:hypothetical protein
MSIHLQSVYKVKVNKALAFYGSKAHNTAKDIFLKYHDKFKNWDIGISDQNEGKKFESRDLLDDICNGKYRFKEDAWLYGYIFEIICDYFGERNLSFSENDVDVNVYAEVHPASGETFFGLPLISDFPSIVCINPNLIDDEIERFRNLSFSNNLKKYFDSDSIAKSKSRFAKYLEVAKKDKLGVAYFVY